MKDKSQSKNWLKTLWAKYNQLCKELGVDNGACRSCVPVVKFDPEKPKEKTAQKLLEKECNKEP